MTTTISPSTTHRSGSSARSAVDHLGEVAGQRPVVAAAQLDLVAVAEHQAAEPVPLGLEQQPAGPRHLVDALASIGLTGGITGRRTAVVCHRLATAPHTPAHGPCAPAHTTGAGRGPSM